MTFLVGSESWMNAIKYQTERVCSLYKEQGHARGFEDLAYRFSRTLVKEIRDYVYHNCIDIALGRVYPESESQRYVQETMRTVSASGEYYEYELS